MLRNLFGQQAPGEYNVIVSETQPQGMFITFSSHGRPTKIFSEHVTYSDALEKAKQLADETGEQVNVGIYVTQTFVIPRRGR